MRSLSPILIGLGLLAGCAGNIADHIGPRSGIIAGQLVRYGFDLNQSACVAERLGAGLTPLQLRRLERVASAVERGYFEPNRLTTRDFAYVAGTMDDPAAASALRAANDACGVTAAEKARAAAKRAAAEKAAAEAAPPEPVWLNLGAAPTGQQIAIDAASLREEGAEREAWFRLTDPGENASHIAYLLRVNCPARTIDPIGHRKPDESGVEHYTEYPPEDDDRMAVESGTVMEIAFLSLCS